MEFDKALHFAVILAWDDLKKAAPPYLVKIEYQCEPESSLDYLSVWLAQSRGDEDLVCDYWTWTSSEHPAGARFRNGHYSEQLAETIGFLMQNQDQFTRLPDACRHGMVLTYAPTEEERTEAAAWLGGLHGNATNICRTTEAAGTTQSDEAGCLESQPWALFYRASETIRGLRRVSKEEAHAEAEEARCSDDRRRDERGTQRMVDEGCPNGRPTPQPDAAGCSGMGGRLLLVGSPIF